MAYIYAWIETDWDVKVMWREWVKAVKNMFQRQLTNVCVKVSVHVHNQIQSLVSGVSDFCEMVQFLWNMFYYKDINSAIYLQTQHFLYTIKQISLISLTYSASRMM